LSKIHSVRPELLSDYVTKFKLTSRVDNDFFEDLARTNIKNNKFHEAALIIYKFKFQEKFDCKEILIKLIDANRVPVAKLLCENDEELKLFLIKCLSTNDNCKVAASLIKEFKYDINNFPDVKERLMKNSMRYYLGRFLYKKPG